MTELIIIAHNIRSTHNIGSIFRTADGFGVSKIIISGYTPYPKIAGDPRLPHIAEKLTKQIHKTALGAEETLPFEYHESPDIDKLKSDGFRIVALEQSPESINIRNYETPQKIALILGEEVEGISSELLNKCDDIVEIPMVGIKESFNVSVAFGIAAYALTK